MSSSPSMLRATLIGGATFGALAGLPIIGALNCACCALVIAAGFVAAYLYSQDCRKFGAVFTPGGGAMVGLVAGMFYAVTYTIVGGLVQWLMGASIEQALEQIESFGWEIPPEAEPFFEFISETSVLVLVVLGFFFWLLVAAVFSTIGGLIGGAVFKVEPAPPPAPPPPPPTYDVMPGPPPAAPPPPSV